ncbi:hypothetical protein AB0M87_04730 [Streptomyces sp. NPDC051320]|uniref:hypothetical protein n=1 Tax=Streptomyces sp. NPDC051320 TaxID=3154644 RepID=UPI00342D6F00
MDTIAALAQRLTDMQDANVGAYRELELTTGGARFDTEQPFGTEAPRKLGTLPFGRRAGGTA